MSESNLRNQAAGSTFEPPAHSQDTKNHLQAPQFGAFVAPPGQQPRAHSNFMPSPLPTKAAAAGLERSKSSQLLTNAPSQPGAPAVIKTSAGKALLISPLKYQTAKLAGRVS